MSWVPPIYVMCNPEKEPARYTFLKEHFLKRGVEKVEYIWTEWGSELTSAQVFQMYDPFIERLGFKQSLTFKSASLSRGELSLMRTFYGVVQKGLESGADSILVFESDIWLREDFLERLKSVVEEAKGVEWDYISLGEGCHTRPSGAPLSYFGPSRLYPAEGFGVFRCCDSMLLRRSFLEKLWRTFRPFRECLDWELNVQFHAWKGKALWVDPPLCEPGSGRWRYVSTLPA